LTSVYFTLTLTSAKPTTNRQYVSQGQCVWSY